MQAAGSELEIETAEEQELLDKGLLTYIGEKNRPCIYRGSKDDSIKPGSC